MFAARATLLMTAVYLRKHQLAFAETALLSVYITLRVHGADREAVGTHIRKAKLLCCGHIENDWQIPAKEILLASEVLWYHTESRPRSTRTNEKE